MKLHNLPKIDISDCFSKSDIARKFNLLIKGQTLNLIKNYILLHNLSTDHFDLKKHSRKYKVITKTCPVCANTFIAQKNHPREKQTCSRACSNTHFRSGKNNPNYKEDNQINYRSLCFRYHKKECIVCKEQNIVAVHHYDENHNNNNIFNLIPLCPTHHVYIHSEFKYLIQNIVDSYIENFKLQHNQTIV